MRRYYGTKKGRGSKRTIAIASTISILINNITKNKTTVGSCSSVVAVCGKSHECPSQVWADTAAEVWGAVWHLHPKLGFFSVQGRLIVYLSSENLIHAAIRKCHFFSRTLPCSSNCVQSRKEIVKGLLRGGLHPHPGPRRGWYERMVDPSDDELDSDDVAATPARAAVAADPPQPDAAPLGVRRPHPRQQRGWYERMVEPSDDELDHDPPCSPARRLAVAPQSKLRQALALGRRPDEVAVDASSRKVANTVWNTDAAIFVPAAREEDQQPGVARVGSPLVDAPNPPANMTSIRTDTWWLPPNDGRSVEQRERIQ